MTGRSHLTTDFKILDNEIVKRSVFISGLIFLSLMLYAQQISFNASAVNIEVSVRVLDGDRFVENLSIDDFEVYENGKLQDVEALYLIKKTEIARREEIRTFSPPQKRHFCLFFEIPEFSPQIKEAVDNFCRNILSPGDNLTIVTPRKAYRMKSETLEVLPKKEISRQIGQILEKDVLSAKAEYKNIVRDIEHVAKILHRSQSGDFQELMRDPTTGRFIDLNQDGLLTRYVSLLKILEEMRKVDEERLIKFSHLLKDQEGKKDIFLFYQRELIPLVEPQLLERFLSLYPDNNDILFRISYLNEFVARDLAFDTERLTKAFFDSSATIHFLFFTRPQKRIPGLDIREESEKMFEALKKMTEATGGLMDSSDNPAYIFKKGVDVLENNYILYYTPQDYKADGSFRSIEVRVKNVDYSVLYRKGYFAENGKNGEK